MTEEETLSYTVRVSDLSRAISIALGTSPADEVMAALAHTTAMVLRVQEEAVPGKRKARLELVLQLIRQLEENFAKSTAAEKWGI